MSTTDYDSLGDLIDDRWFRERLAHRRRAVAAAVGQMIGLQQYWVHRRTQNLEFIDTEHVRWSVEIDFAVPLLREYPDDLPLLVPLSLPEKSRLVDLSVTDQAGKPLPVLTRGENARIAGEVLVLQAEQVLHRRSVDDTLKQKLYQVAGVGHGLSSPDAAARRHEVEEIVDYLHSLDTDTELNGVDEDMRTLWRDPSMKALLREFGTRFILLAQVDSPDGRSPRRRIVNVSYERRFRVRNPLQEKYRWQKWREDLALSPYSFAIALRTFRAAQSYHLKITPPDEVFVVDATIRRYVSIKRNGQTTWSRKPLASRDRKTDRAHLHVTSRSLGALQPDEGEIGDLMVLQFNLFPRFGALIPALVAVGAMTAILLAGLALHLSGVRSGTEAVALIVAAPALFAPWFVPGDHALVRRMFFFLRVLLLAATASVYAASAALAIDLSSVQTLVIWLIATVLSSAASAMLGYSAFTSYRLRSRRRGIVEPETQERSDSVLEPELVFGPAAPRGRTSEMVLDEIARQYDYFFHIVSDSGEGMSFPWNGETIASRSRRDHRYRSFLRRS